MSTNEGTGRQQVESHPSSSPNARFLSEIPQPSFQHGSRPGRAMSLSLGTHLAGLFVFLLLAGGRTAMPVAPIIDTAKRPMIWVQLGPDDGGVGGGNRTPGAPPTAELRGDRASTVPALEPPAVEARSEPVETTAQPPIVLPLQPLASDLRDLPGSVHALSVGDPASQGPGTGDGGGGDGAIRGPGSGDRGLLGGTGDGPGGFGRVTAPQLIRQVKPEYTNEAMRAKVQGVVALEAVVLPDGMVGDVRIVRSLDRVFGLDQQAITAVRQWRFMPGTRQGKPLPVIVAIELTFALR